MADPLSGIAIGDPFMGGYFAGIIDTINGNIIAADTSQIGLRYALIVSPRFMELIIDRSYKSANTAAPVATNTRWNGLAATAAMAADAETYLAADYCAGIVPPTDAASAWYLPAMDELELIYRNLKCSLNSNIVGTRLGSTFPGVDAAYGENLSSDPQGAGYTAGNPTQTSAPLFKSSGSQAFR